MARTARTLKWKAPALKYANGKLVKKAKKESSRKQSRSRALPVTSFDQWKEIVLKLYPDAGWINTTISGLERGGYHLEVGSSRPRSKRMFWACVGAPSFKVWGFWHGETDWRVLGFKATPSIDAASGRLLDCFDHRLAGCSSSHLRSCFLRTLEIRSQTLGGARIKLTDMVDSTLNRFCRFLKFPVLEFPRLMDCSPHSLPTLSGDRGSLAIHD